MKRGERGSCQMQMTSLGEGRRGGGEVAVWWGGVGRVLWRGGGLSSLFFPFREHPLLFSIVPLCDSWSWQCEGENKNELAVQPGSASDATPPSKKKKKEKKQSQPGGPWGQNLKQNTLKLTQHFFLKASPKLLKRQTLCVMRLQNWNYPRAFVILYCFLFFLEEQRFVPSSHAIEWHFSRHALHTHTGILIYQELFRIRIRFPRLLEGTKMVRPPVVWEANFYLAAFSLNTRRGNRLQCSLLHEKARRIQG